MELVRLKDALPYDAPRHYGMSTLRLQGGDATSTEKFTIGLSQALPAGGAERSSSPLERVYLVIEGELFVSVGDEETVLGPLDSVRIPPDAEREIANRTNTTTTFVVVMQTREEQ